MHEFELTSNLKVKFEFCSDFMIALLMREVECDVM